MGNESHFCWSSHTKLLLALMFGTDVWVFCLKMGIVVCVCWGLYLMLLGNWGYMFYAVKI